MDLLVDPDQLDGLREGIERALREAIREGRLTVGDRLPSTRALARELGVARGTVSAAYDQLSAEGYLATHQGAPSRVAWAPSEAALPVPPEAPALPSWDLRPGRANASSFPREAWSSAYRRVLRRLPEDVLGYGSSEGTTELRTALTAYLGRTRSVYTAPDRLLVCGGFTEALTITCRMLRDAGASTVATENPNAPRYREIIRDAGLRVVSVGCDGDGIRTDELAGRSADAVLVTPAHQYPLGVTLSARRRAELVEWARRHDALIIEDDYDGEFRFDRRPVGALQQMDPERVAYTGTASKTLAPGVRLGWMALPRRWTDAAIGIKERMDRGNGVFDQLVLAELITSGSFDRHVRRMRAQYRDRRDQLLARLRGFPLGRATGIAAGLHVVVPFPDLATEQRVLAVARRRGLLLHTLTDYWHRPGPQAWHGLIVGYGTPAAHAFRPGLDALEGVLTAAID